MLLCWRMNFCPSLKPISASSSITMLYSALSVFPSPLTSFSVPAEKRHQHSMTHSSPYFPMGIVCSEWCAVLVFLHTWWFACRPKSLILVSSDPNSFCHMFAASCGLWCTANRAFCGFLSPKSKVWMRLKISFQELK